MNGVFNIYFLSGKGWKRNGLRVWGWGGCLFSLAAAVYDLIETIFNSSLIWR